MSDTTKRRRDSDPTKTRTRARVQTDREAEGEEPRPDAAAARGGGQRKGTTIAMFAATPSDELETLTPTFSPAGEVASDDPETFFRELFEEGKPRLVSVGEIGCGGMGSVEEVVDIPLRRHLAMKIIHDSFDSKKGEMLHRFVREARVNAQLEHPNIVPVHEIGRTRRDRLFFTMKLVDGRSLEEMLRGLGSPPYEHTVLLDLLEVLIKVCDALSYAHSRGVIHCDIKPENIMVGDFGQVYVMDWGVARIVNEEVGDEKRAGMSFLGTPAFMPPEQARGQLARLDRRADVFGLGAVLYRVLTGQPPYLASSIPIVVARAAIGNYKTPSELAVVPAELERIALRAMAQDPEQRYPDAESLKLDLVRFQRGIGAFPETSFPAGTSIIREGDRGDAAYFIVSGACEAFRVIEGRRVSLRVMGPGEAFGETALLSPGPRTASVEAIEDTVACVITEKVFQYELGTMKPWMRGFVRTVADRFREREAKSRPAPGPDSPKRGK
jgi:serine/threonine-protein kinase